MVYTFHTFSNHMPYVGVLLFIPSTTPSISMAFKNLTRFVGDLQSTFYVTIFFRDFHFCINPTAFGSHMLKPALFPWTNFPLQNSPVPPFSKSLRWFTTNYRILYDDYRIMSNPVLEGINAHFLWKTYVISFVIMSSTSIMDIILKYMTKP
jgi:hypothetical protein